MDRILYYISFRSHYLWWFLENIVILILLFTSLYVNKNGNKFISMLNL